MFSIHHFKIPASIFKYFLLKHSSQSTFISCFIMHPSLIILIRMNRGQSYEPKEDWPETPLGLFKKLNKNVAPLSYQLSKHLFKEL